MSVDPVTPYEWQDAVDAAYACQVLESARTYGLIKGGPAVDLQRCYQILREGRERGFHPAADAVERFIAALRETFTDREGRS